MEVANSKMSVSSLNNNALIKAITYSQCNWQSAGHNFTWAFFTFFSILQTPTFTILKTSPPQITSNSMIPLYSISLVSICCSYTNIHQKSFVEILNIFLNQKMI